MIARAQFVAIMPNADARVWFGPINDAMNEFGITTPARVAAFLANLAPESNELNTLEENLNYSAQGLAKTWPSRYANDDGTPNELAKRLHRNPVAIANNVYADRMGNGDESLGNGWKHRGAGPIQVTGKDNQYAVALYFNIDPERVREWLLTPEGGARSAAWYWKTNGCNVFADAGDFDGCCDLVNRGRKTARHGDAIGFEHRAKYYATACKVMGVEPVSKGVTTK